MLLRMHKRRANFDPLKFTPSVIANRIDLPIIEVAEYFKSHSLNECALKYECSAVTIKRKLKAAGYNTAVHNHSKLATERYAATVKEKPSDVAVKQLYLNENLDAKTISEMHGLHFNTIRNITRRLGLKKSREQISASMVQRHLLQHGIRHPAQRPDVIKKTSISLNKASYRNESFKSITELGFALYLDKIGKEWYYEEMRVPYVDMLNGTQRIYIIDFTVITDDKVNWIEIKPNNNMIPDDKRIYASRRAEQAGVIYRGLTEQERELIWDTVYDGFNFDKVEFHYRSPRSTSAKITYYFKSEIEAATFEMDGWRQLTKPTNRGALWKKILVRK